MANGGSASCAASAWLQSTADVTALAAATTDLWQKIRFKVDSLRSLGVGGSGMALTACGQLTGTGTDKWDVGMQGITGGKYEVKAIFRHASTTAISSGNDLQSALPANGNYLDALIWYSTTLGTCGCSLFDDSGNAYASATASGISVALPTGAGNGLVAINDCNITGFDANVANVYNGSAFYTSTPPTSGAAQYNPPTINDTGLIALWWMNDAIGSSAAAAAVGGQSLGDNGTVTYSGNTGLLWGPPSPIAPSHRITVVNRASLFRAHHY